MVSKIPRCLYGLLQRMADTSWTMFYVERNRAAARAHVARLVYEGWDRKDLRILRYPVED